MVQEDLRAYMTSLPADQRLLFFTNSLHFAEYLDTVEAKGELHGLQLRYLK